MNESARKRTIVKRQISSAYLGQERTLRIFLPPGFDESRAYPVIYCQDGLEFFNYGRIATIATEQILENHMPPCIIVGIDVDLRRRNEQYGPDGREFAAYCDFVVQEVIPLVEREFAAEHSADARILAGDSLGATVALHLALDHPHLFRRVISFSGAYMPSSVERILQASDLGGLDMYMLVGRQETAVDTSLGVFDFLEINREISGLLIQRGAEVAYYEEDGEHKWGFWQKYMAAALHHVLIR